MKTVSMCSLMAVVSTFFALQGCLSDDVDSCDLDPFFSDSKQNVNCIETAPNSNEYVCTCPDATTFPSSGTCEKPEAEQGRLIDSGCPTVTDGQTT